MSYCSFFFIFIFSFLTTTSAFALPDWQEIEPSAIITQEKGKIRYLDISPDDTMLVTCSNKGECKLWDLAGNKLHTLSKKNRFQALSCSFNHDSTKILCFYGAKDLEQSSKYSMTKAGLWDKQGNEIINFNKNCSFIKFIDFTADAKNILALYLDDTAALLDCDGNEVQNFAIDFSHLFAVDLNPQGNEIFLREAYNSFNHQLWNVDKNELIPLPNLKVPIIATLFIPETSILIIVLAHHEAIKWDYINNTQRNLKGNLWNSNLSLSPQKDVLMSYGKGYDSINVLDMEGNKIARLKKVFYIHRDLPLFSPDGSRIIALYSDEVMVIWNYRTNEKRFLIGHKDRIKSVAFSPNGDSIVTTSKDRTAMVWNLKGDLLFILNGHQHSLKDAFFTLDGKKIVTYDNKNVMIWDIPAVDN